MFEKQTAPIPQVKDGGHSLTKGVPQEYNRNRDSSQEELFNIFAEAHANFPVSLGQKLGIPESVLFDGPGQVGLVFADISGRYWQPGGKTPLLVVPAKPLIDLGDPEIENSTDLGDLIAFSPKNPKKMYVFNGMEPVINREFLEYDCFMQGVMTLFENPLDYLQADRRGGVIVSWDHMSSLAFPSSATIICNQQVASRIKGLFRPPRLPKFEIVAL